MRKAPNVTTAKRSRTPPCIDRAAVTPNTEAKAPISKFPIGAVPTAVVQAPIALPLKSLGTNRCSNVWENKSERAMQPLIAVIARIATYSEGAQPRTSNDMPKTCKTIINPSPCLPPFPNNEIKAIPKMPPAELKAFNIPNPPGPIFHMSRAMLGNKACEVNPSNSTHITNKTRADRVLLRFNSFQSSEKPSVKFPVREGAESPGDLININIKNAQRQPMDITKY